MTEANVTPRPVEKAEQIRKIHIKANNVLALLYTLSHCDFEENMEIVSLQRSIEVGHDLLAEALSDLLDVQFTLEQEERS